MADSHGGPRRGLSDSIWAPHSTKREVIEKTNRLPEPRSSTLPHSTALPPVQDWLASPEAFTLRATASSFDNKNKSCDQQALQISKKNSSEMNTRVTGIMESHSPSTPATAATAHLQSQINTPPHLRSLLNRVASPRRVEALRDGSAQTVSPASVRQSLAVSEAQPGISPAPIQVKVTTINALHEKLSNSSPQVAHRGEQPAQSNVETALGEEVAQQTEKDSSLRETEFEKWMAQRNQKKKTFKQESVAQEEEQRQNFLDPNIMVRPNPAVQSAPSFNEDPVPPTPKFLGVARNSHFNANPDSQVDTFQDFLRDKSENPVMNGKRYVTDTSAIARIIRHDLGMTTNGQTKGSEPATKSNRNVSSSEETRKAPIVADLRSLPKKENIVPKLTGAAGLKLSSKEELQALNELIKIQLQNKAPPHLRTAAIDAGEQKTAVSLNRKPSTTREMNISDAGIERDWVKDDAINNQEWQPAVLSSSPGVVDMNNPEFLSGRGIIVDSQLTEPIEHDFTKPDLANSENVKKQLEQRAGNDAKRFTKIFAKTKILAEQTAANEARQLAAVLQEDHGPHPHAPKMEIYLRPANASDVKEIVEIYNSYVVHSTIPEDQELISFENLEFVLKCVESEQLPFIVAVKGKLPESISKSNMKNSKAPILPEHEDLAGFAFAQSDSYGLGGLRTGRSRANAELNVYVDQRYLRKGVGRCLLDRLLQTLSVGYGAKDGYDWVNPTNNDIYKPGKLWYRLFFKVSTLPKDDPNIDWMRAWMKKFWFHEEATLKGFARSTGTTGTAQFMDLVIFVGSAAQPSEWEANI